MTDPGIHTAATSAGPSAHHRPAPSKVTEGKRRLGAYSLPPTAPVGVALGHTYIEIETFGDYLTLPRYDRSGWGRGGTEEDFTYYGSMVLW